jgi:hypothetical protein
MQHPALGELWKILTKPETEDADRLRAIREVLDRTGLDRERVIKLVQAPEDPWAMAMTAFLSELSSPSPHTDATEDEDPDITDADIIEDGEDAEDEYPRQEGEGETIGLQSSVGPYDTKPEDALRGEYDSTDLNRPETEPVVRSRRPRMPSPNGQARYSR